jgi:peptidoglycan-associated lipoprotein
MKNAVLCIALAGLLAACGSTEVKKDVPVVDRTTPQQPTGSPTGSTTSGVTNPPIASTALTDPGLTKRSVYFDYDSNAVKDEYRGVVQAHSKFMAEKRDTTARIEGNCDERGSREYNLALGQRRAEAVKKVMTVLGVPEGRIETVSYGEEKPMAPGHDEAAWAQNRRADIKYSGEK